MSCDTAVLIILLSFFPEFAQGFGEEDCLRGARRQAAQEMLKE